MDNTKQLGLLGELKAQYDFIKEGYDISIPLGDYCSYDLIAIKGEKQLRIQVKTTEFIKDGKMQFKLNSTNYYVSKIYTEQDADLFYLYCLENGQGYLLPIKEAPKGGQIYLRITPTKNNQTIGINFAKDFVFEDKIKEL